MQGTAWLYVRQLVNSQAWQRRQFSGPRDFKVQPVFQDEIGLTTVIPAGADGRQLNINSMLQLGNDEAARHGIEQPTRQEVVHLGLYDAARRNPLLPSALKSGEVHKIARAALLDQDAAPTDITENELELVTERFADAVEPHLNDDLDDFNRWFVGANNSLVQQIAKRKKAPGGVLDRKRVEAALAELGWRSLRHWATCIEIQMRSVAAELPQPLVSEDLARFELTYYQQEWLGGLSLCIFGERFGFVREAVWNVIEPPFDETSKGILLRMLQYYAMASTMRREVDRLQSRKRRLRS